MHKELLNQCNITFDYLKNTENGQKLLKEMIGKILNIDVTDITILKPKIELISQDEREIAIIVNNTTPKTFVNILLMQEGDIHQIRYAECPYLNELSLTINEQHEMNYEEIFVNTSNINEKYKNEFFFMSNDKEHYLNNFRITEFNIVKILNDFSNIKDKEEIYNYLYLIFGSTEQRKEILEKCNNQLFIEFDKNIKEN